MVFEVSFSKYEYPYEGHLDPNLSYKGVFAITRDNVHKTRIHQAYSFLQGLLNKCFKIGIETDYNHGMLVIDSKEDELMIAHVAGEGMKIKRVNYLNYPGNDVTSLVVYVPTDEKLRTLIAKYALQTTKEPVKISLWKIATHWMEKPTLRTTPHIRVLMPSLIYSWETSSSIKKEMVQKATIAWTMHLQFCKAPFLFGD